MINILITGGNGQLASCIKDLAIDYVNLNFIFTDFLDLDITNLNQLNNFFNTASNDIQYCINCAAYTAVDKAEKESEKAIKINTEGSKNLALACLKHNITLIHVSTDFVFDGKGKTPYLETDPALPISVYGETKLKGEQEIEQILTKYFIFRTSWLYSEHGNNFMKTMLKLAETKNELSVVSDQFGTPTYAKDLAKLIVHTITSKSVDYGVYHYSNIGSISWFDFAKAIFEENRTPIKINAITTSEFPTLAKRPAYSVLDKSKIRKMLNIEIPNWRESLKQALDNHKNL
ncbi:dTDP-4-dehydrorhamnose reductase [Algibacter pectinivorans]|uniref:dTDP-4-dehydrorhamnose reductase n=1 Tax=Algibacter pectinivorans TaxID=870482 RepID=A0A1I1NEX8_9FLAO|nr:dTDP-4-dehydrorhamnose reductase [Algibacter pectinivorans]SFC96045.1 dTDP-4-dehydrorhamnose reductase [Algibacter pectinivorans]